MSKSAESTVRVQARRYLEARYGDAVWFRAPETFENVLERWIWAVASGAEGTLGEECIAAIETAMRQFRERQPDNAGDSDRWEDPRDTYGGQTDA